MDRAALTAKPISIPNVDGLDDNVRPPLPSCTEDGNARLPPTSCGYCHQPIRSDGGEGAV